MLPGNTYIFAAVDGVDVSEAAGRAVEGEGQMHIEHGAVSTEQSLVGWLGPQPTMLGIRSWSRCKTRSKCANQGA